MSDKTTEEKRAELEAAGYRVSGKDLVYKDDITYDTTYNDTGLSAIEQAYAHLLKERELEALRKLWDMACVAFEYPREIDMMSGGIPHEQRAWFREQMESRFEQLRLHNITDTEESDSE